MVNEVAVIILTSFDGDKQIFTLILIPANSVYIVVLFEI